MEGYAHTPTPTQETPHDPGPDQSNSALSGEPEQSHSHTQDDDFLSQLLSAAHKHEHEPQPDPLDLAHRAEEAKLIEEGGNTAQRQDNRATATPPAYDPASLLNPKLPVKRPARDSVSTEDNASDHGQISLVERLHNVHQRTASPAKRARTDNEHQQKQLPKSSIQGGSTLNLQRENNTPSASIQSQSTAIDLTMSKCRSII